MSKVKLSKQQRDIMKVIKPFGYTIVKGKRHHKIVDREGKLIIGFSGTPSDGHWYKNVINQMIKMGKLPGVEKW